MAQLDVEKTFQVAVGHHQAGRLPQAEAAYRQILAQHPHHAGALHHLGMIAAQVGRNDVAVELLRRAIAHNPNYAEAYGNLGNALWRLGQLDEAIRAYRQAIALRPGYAEVCYNLGLALGEKGQPEEAIAAWRQAIGAKSNYPEAFNNIGNVLKDSGKVEEAVAAFRQAIALDPAFSVAHSNLVLAMRNHPAYDAATIAQEHACWNCQHAEPLKQFIQPHTNDRNPDRRLRIGYVSPDLRQHSVAYFLENLLAEHDSASVEVICYCDVARPDAMTARLQKLCTQWRNIVGMTNAQADQKVREDRIDILVDLAGHTANNRLLLFARKPAPIQVAYLGYPDTTGLATMDYRLTDAFADPPGTADDSYSEQLVRLPETFLCYRPPDAAPEIGAVPALAIGAVTFGSFNALSKINAPLVAMWSKTLHEIPNSRLILKSLGLGGAAARQHILESFAAHQIAPDRIELIGWTANKTEHLQLYNRIDIALDTYPYHGTTTTCEAMWMGVPVITLAGNAHVSRVGVSILCNVGLPELVADSRQTYVRLASELARDIPRLRLFRSSLRQRMEQSPLMEAPRFARNVEAAYRRMWRTWCGALSPEKNAGQPKGVTGVSE